MIDREKLLGMSGQFPEYEEVVLPNFGTVRIKAMTVREKDVFDKNVREKKYGPRPGLIVACTIDERGIRVFEFEDIPKIDELPSYIVEPLVDAALRVNKYTDQEREELAKNSNGQSGVLSSV